MIPPIDKLSNLKAAFSKYREALVVRPDLSGSSAVEAEEFGSGVVACGDEDTIAPNNRNGGVDRGR